MHFETFPLLFPHLAAILCIFVIPIFLSPMCEMRLTNLTKAKADAEGSEDEARWALRR